MSGGNYSMTGKRELARHRFRQSKERWKAAQTLCENKCYTDAMSRSYYAMFTAARALLATRSLDSRKHSGVLALFNKHFVKEGIVPKEMGRMIAEAKGAREESDYGDFVTFTKSEAEEQVRSAKEFIEHIGKALAGC